MSRKTWLALAIAAIVAASFAASVDAAKEGSNADGRSGQVTRGLDYLHARQKENGALSNPASTAWGILGAVASGERMGSSAWTVKTKNPFEYLESISHESAATSADVSNAPIYYARAIMAYVAVGKSSSIDTAGTPSVDLLTELYSYQDTTVTSATYGSFSPSTSMRSKEAVSTTCWAILAMHACGADSDTAGAVRYVAACDWLADQQRDSGGFPIQASSTTADITTTSLAVQALVAADDGKTAYATALAAAEQFLESAQITTDSSNRAGFPKNPGGSTANCEATAAAIQAIFALGDRPEEAEWKVGKQTPVSALGRLQRKTGAYRLTSKLSQRPMTTTSWALVALSRKSFTAYPLDIPEARTAFKFKPLLRGISPKNGTKFTTTSVVLIRATYTDYYSKGTGILPTACRVYVDSSDKSKPAVIGNYGLRLQLKNVPNGTHTYKIELRDRAGNLKTVQRTFTVSVASPTPTPTSTYESDSASTWRPSTTYPRTSTSSPTPSSTLYPSTTPSYSAAPVTGPVIASPSSSPSAGASDDGGSASGFVGGTLLAMLPVGAVISYLVLHRREEALDEASVGTILAGGGSAWDRLKRSLSKIGDIIKPNRS